MNELITGTKGGRYYMKNGRKVYVKNEELQTNKKCTPGNRKKFAKVVNGVCVRYGDPNMTIKKHIPSHQKSFCARHKCTEKCDKATPGYQSCLKWNCKVCT